MSTGSVRSILPPWAYPWVHQGLKRIFPGCLWELGSPHIALTFDDGPHPEYTPKLLDTLQEFGIQANFFVLGEQAQRWPHLIARMAAEGHHIGLHGWQHRSFPTLDPQALRASLRRTQEVLAAATGGIPDTFRQVRPPNGLVTPCTLHHLKQGGFQTVMWTVVPEDWLDLPVSVIVERVMTQIRPGALIVLHDGVFGGSQVSDVIRQLAPLLQAQPWPLITLSAEKSS